MPEEVLCIADSSLQSRRLEATAWPGGFWCFGTCNLRGCTYEAVLWQTPATICQKVPYVANAYDHDHHLLNAKLGTASPSQIRLDMN